MKTQIVFRNASSSQLGRVTMAGFIGNGRGVPPFRKFGQYALVYLVDGTGRYQDTNGRNQPVGPGDVILVFPKLPHSYGPGPSEHWTEFYLCFDGPVFDLWQTRGLLDPRQPLYHLEPIQQWVQRFESILGAPRRPGFAPPLLEICRLQQLLAEVLLGGNHNLAHQQDVQWTSRACALLESDLESALKHTALAQRFGMSYESFRKRFTRILGQSPTRYRAARLMDRACELMQQGQLSDKEIAHALGFCDEFYFSRRFRQITGQTARQFRQRFGHPGSVSVAPSVSSVSRGRPKHAS
jgi:AraC-like DNA-binding protein